MQKQLAPSVTLSDIDAAIISEHYFTAFDGCVGVNIGVKGAPIFIGNGQINGPLSCLTFCVLVLQNGFTVTGESACVSPANFNAEKGREVARKHAVEKIWPLLGYALCSELARPVLTEADAAADLAGTPRPGQPG